MIIFFSVMIIKFLSLIPDFKMSRFACLLVVAGATTVTAQFSFDKMRCGQLTCQFNEYCSTETNRCAPCSMVCNKTHHNYDFGVCAKDCQGLLTLNEGAFTCEGNKAIYLLAFIGLSKDTSERGRASWKPTIFKGLLRLKQVSRITWLLSNWLAITDY